MREYLDRLKKDFPYDLDFTKVNFRETPHLYRVGRGEMGVLLVEPYKSEILPHWRFKTPEIADKSAARIYQMFLTYLEQDDFVGADMARKFLQMGWTRSRRYANHKSGKKYDGPVPLDKKGQSGSHGREKLPDDVDPVKAECAHLFERRLDYTRQNEKYKKMKKEWLKTIDTSSGIE